MSSTTEVIATKSTRAARGAVGTFASRADFGFSQEELRSMFVFFSNRLGLISSIIISAALTLLLLSLCSAG